MSIETELAFLDELIAEYQGQLAYLESSIIKYQDRLDQATAIREAIAPAPEPESE